MQKAIFENNNTSSISLSNEDKIDLTEILATLIESKWLIISTTVMLLTLGIGKSFMDTPIFQTDALLQVEANSLSLTSLEPGGPIVKNEIPVLAEIELLNSRTLIGKVINNLKLDIIVKPKYFPFFGEMIARRYESQNHENKVSNPLFGQNQFSWGGETIKVDALNIPPNLLNKPFILIAGNNGTYQLKYKESLILEGEVGKLASNKLENQPKPITIFVSILKSRPNTEFTVMRQSESNAISELKNNLHAAEKGKLTRLIELTLESSSPESAVQVLNEIINIYLRQNVEQKSAEAQKTLEFLEKQMPLLKEQLDSATNALNDFRTKVGSIDLDIETQNLLEGVVKTKTEITLLQQKRDELREKFTESHPSVIAIDKQIDRLQSQVKAHDHKIGVLPETQQIILKLSRDVKVNTELYTALLNKAQTLRVAKAGTVGDVRVIDYAELPNLPIKPKKTLIAVISLFLGLVLGIALAFISKALRRGVESSDLIENKLHIPVYATIPHSAEQEKLSKKISRTSKRNNSEPLILARQNKDDIAIESLRSLRTTLHFAFLEAQNNIIMITGPCPGIGKTFISVNLASVLADAGKKILLIDGDMRRGYINKVLGIGRGHGLSELISTSSSNLSSLLDLAIHKIPTVNFDFISTGAIPPNPSELLLHERFGTLLESASKNYDHVIIDSPPILAVTDASIIGRMASATLMVVKAGQHPMRELEDSVKRLTQAGVQLKGIVFNDLPEASSRFGYQYGYTQYIDQYRPQKAR
jgi:tyrosine-protein kinase Etk/Wzc